MTYGKKEALMTRGMAILCMLLLHLFCRQGADVLGTPLIWLNETTPFVYWFGFFAEICVPIYSLCAGYAQRVSDEAGSCNWRINANRIKRLLINYWIILVLFSVIGLVFDKTGSMPGSVGNFLKAFVLLHSYNGAWWYLNTYIILLLISPVIIMPIVRKLDSRIGIVLCFCGQVGWYLVERMGLWPAGGGNVVASFVLKESANLLDVLPFFIFGAFLCKGNWIDKCAYILEKYFSYKVQKVLLITAVSVLFVVVNVLHKAVVMGAVAAVVFGFFNLIRKSDWVERVFLFLGKHSTNIWLRHMFFYAYIFEGLVEMVKYPFFMLLFIILLCVITSYIIMAIEKKIYKIKK